VVARRDSHGRLDALTAVRDGITEYVRTAGEAMRDFGLPHPVFGMFDGVQWVLFASAHADNHVPQLRRLGEAREPGLPARSEPLK
jgi:hypothetical protein